MGWSAFCQEYSWITCSRAAKPTVCLVLGSFKRLSMVSTHCWGSSATKRCFLSWAMMPCAAAGEQTTVLCEAMASSTLFCMPLAILSGAMTSEAPARYCLTSGTEPTISTPGTLLSSLILAVGCLPTTCKVTFGFFLRNVGMTFLINHWMHCELGR